MKTLSDKQKKVLGSLSNKAFRCGCSGGLSYEDWRHEVTFHATGKESWRELTQAEYVPLCNAFRRILGLPPMADRTPKDDRQALLYALHDRMAHWECPAAYWAKIVRERFGRHHVTASTPFDTAVADFTARELLDLLRTLNNRLRKRSAKDSQALGIPPAVEVHTTPGTMPPPRLASHRGDILTPRPRHEN